ncbi:adenosylcobinamide-GDP ribazoletransferase [Dehalococcoidia bacterium]|nr:adenosylcobinamide-GDP ribazoletransferase [Dehalococcoidia bacterium]
MKHEGSGLALRHFHPSLYSVNTTFLGYVGAALVVVVWVITFLLARILSLRLGGLTGDTYGAIIELSEVTNLILIIVIGKLGGTSWLDLYL